MFTTRSHNLALIILIVTVTVAVLASLLLLESGAGLALAQGGASDGKHEMSNYEAMQEVIKGLDLSGIIVTPLDTSSVGEPGEGAIGPQSDGSGVEVVPIAAFKHDGNTANDWFHYFAGGYIRNDSSDTPCLMAPAYPPDGATLTAFSFSLVDDSASNELPVVLRRVRLATGVVDTLAGGYAVLDSSTPVEVKDSTIESGKQVVSSAYGYYVTLCFPPDTYMDILLYGARLFYTP